MALLLAALPSYLAVYEELASRRGENFSVAELVAEVAREADDLLSRGRDHGGEARLESIAEALERVATDRRAAAAAVIDAFSSALSPTARLRFDAYLGPAAARLAGGGEGDDAADNGRLSPAAPPRLRPRPRRYSGRGPRRRRRL